jgi:predicted phosphodiesterase
MKEIVDKVPVWYDLQNLLLIEKKSLLVHSPRFYGTEEFVESLASSSNQDHFDLLRINSNEHISSGELDYKSIWKLTRTQLRLNIKRKINAKIPYLKSIEEIISRRDKNLLIVITGGGQGKEEYQYNLVNLFYKLYIGLPPENNEKVTILVLDDYSLYYHARGEIDQILPSPWILFKRKHIRSLSLEQITECVSKLQADDDFKTINPGLNDFLATRIQQLTGGHIGLVMELLKYVMKDNWCFTKKFKKEEWHTKIKEVLHHSPILESLRRCLLDNPEGFSRSALEFKEPKLLSDRSGPIVRILYHLGILQRKDLCDAVLCTGVIKELIDKLYQSSLRSESFGTAYSDLGPRIYQPKELIPGDTDFVIAHISDLHVGEKFPFQLPHLGIAENERRRSIVEIFRKDLEKLKLIGRLDAIVISGDFTENADMQEFFRARDLLEQVAQAIELDISKFIIVAGNHDIQWHPSEVTIIDGLTGTSRENFKEFRKSIGLEPEKLVDFVPIQSRSSKRLLRILALDSNLVESPEGAGIGYASPKILFESQDLLKTGMTGEFQTEHIYTWLVIHHHVFPISSPTAKEAYEKKFSVMGNVAQLLSFANKNKIDMILHGHEHQPNVTVSRRWPTEEEIGFAPIVSIGGGSFSGYSSILEPFSKNHYFLIYRRSKETIIRSRVLSAKGLAFNTHSDMIVPHHRRKE